MLELVRRSSGRVLDPDEVFRADWARCWPPIGTFYKLERLQYFDERGFPSWDAFARGQWEEALAELEKDRPNVVAEHAEDRVSNVTSYRVRVVELPVSPYVQWELYALMIRAECGEKIRVVGAEAVAHYEADGILPELIFLGTEVMYETTFGPKLRRKFTDPELLAGCLADVRVLFDEGEDLRTFFEREVRPLRPPGVDWKRTSSTGS